MTTPTTQALTIAISDSGLTKLFDALVVSGPAFAAHLNSWIPPVITVPAANVANTNIINYALTLSPGAANNASATLASVSQLAPGSGQFVLTFDVDITLLFLEWLESGATEYTVAGRTYTHPFETACGLFSLTATGLVLTVTIEIVQVGSAWTFRFVSATSDASSANLPDPLPYPATSIFNEPHMQSAPCTGTFAVAQLESALGGIDYTAAAQAAIPPILASIKESGTLTSDIAFAWTPNTFSFPTTATGLLAGVTGIASYNGTAYAPGTTPPSLPLPALPAANDVEIYAADYLFNSLYWAYNEANALTQTITASMIGTQASQLNTATYRDSIPQLFKLYPNAPMQVVITQKCAPTIAFVSGYQLPPPYLFTLTDLYRISVELPDGAFGMLSTSIVGQAFNTSQALEYAVSKAVGTSPGFLGKNDFAAVPSRVCAVATTSSAGVFQSLSDDLSTALFGMTGIPYSSQADFHAAVVNCIGSKPAAQYQAEIETAAATMLATFTHQPTCEYQVMSGETYVPAFTIQITETDILTQFWLGTSGSAQTLQCQYQVPGGAGDFGIPTASLSSTEVGAITAENFAKMWRYVLAAQYSTVVQAVASVGVPVPYIEGYTFQNSNVSIQVGYLDVTADVVFNS